MSDEVSLPAPKNRLLTAVSKLIDFLIEGLGVDAAIAAATAEFPPLAWPVIRQMFRGSVELIAGWLELNSFRLAARFIIRFQNEQRLEDFDEAIEPLRQIGATQDEVEAARRAADRLIRRDR
jgi:hypothetical protein